MNKRKNKKIGGLVLCVFIWTTGMSLGQSHHFSPDGLGGGPVPMSSAYRLRIQQWIHLNKSARAALETGDFALEEDYARQSLALGVGVGLSQALLAQALKDQGKDQEALQIYKVMIVEEKDSDQNNLVPYALLLLKSGQLAQSLAVYETVMLNSGDEKRVLATSRFSTDIPQPKELAAALHIIQGIIYQGSVGWGYHLRREEGMQEFAQALQLAPDAPLTNYYYAYGWQHLDPKSRMKVADAPRARAALQKAAASEDSEVRKVAGEALRGMK